MTQEELDALMQSDDDISSLDASADSSADADSTNSQGVAESSEDFETQTIDPHDFRVDADKAWPTPPPTEDHKVVHQLDEVTKDSEIKGTQIFDQLEIMSNGTGAIEKQVKLIDEYIKSQEALFTKLCAAFPHIQSFQTALESSQNIAKSTKDIINTTNDISDASMQAMDLMQYQDIHRQKIERVVNVMRALAQYMNSLFESKVDDSKRVSSAVFIAGDNKEDVASEDDIEALIASFGAKK